MKSTTADRGTQVESATKRPKIQKIWKNRNPVYQEQDVQRKHQKILQKLGQQEYRGHRNLIYGRNPSLLAITVGEKKHSIMKEGNG
jgi:hypothetical protein